MFHWIFLDLLCSEPKGAPKGDDKRMGRGQSESDKKQMKSVFQ